MQTADLFLFAGQSNMAGRGVSCDRFPEKAPPVIPGAGWEYRAVSAPGRLFPITEPFGENENRSGGISENLKSGSMVSAFVNAFVTRMPLMLVSILALISAMALRLSRKACRIFLRRE